MLSLLPGDLDGLDAAALEVYPGREQLHFLARPLVGIITVDHGDVLRIGFVQHQPFVLVLEINHRLVLSGGDLLDLDPDDGNLNRAPL